MKVRWTQQAFDRLAEIEDFLRADSPATAERIADGLIRRSEVLARFPLSGRRLPEIPGSELRELIEGTYRIAYRVLGRSVEVLTVFDGRRLLPAEDLADLDRTDD